MEEDDDYVAFVADMWAAESIPLGGILVERGYSATNRTISELVSLVEGQHGRLYVNAAEGGTRKTYRPEMHRWWRDGLPIHTSAFEGVRLGFPPDTVVAYEMPARTLEEALSPEWNRLLCQDKAYAIDYQDPERGYGWTVISKVVRQRDTLTARSHYRFGHRESFAHSKMQEVRLVPSLTSVPLAEFIESKINKLS